MIEEIKNSIKDGVKESVKDIVSGSVNGNLSVKDSVTGVVKEGVKGVVKDAIKDKLALIIIASVAIIAVVVFLAINPFNWNFSWNPNGGLKIDKTENIVSEIKNISEFTTAQHHEEFVIKDSKMEYTKFGSLMKRVNLGEDSTEVELVVIAKGSVRAGFNLKGITESDIKVKSDTLYFSLPKAEIFDVIVNPSDFETFVEDGQWSHDEFVTLQSQAKGRIKQNAIDHKILENAENHGKKKLTALFKGFGFNEVIFTNKE